MAVKTAAIMACCWVEEMVEMWRKRTMEILGSVGVTAMSELDQKGKNEVVKALAAAVKRYEDALNAKES